MIENDDPWLLWANWLEHINPLDGQPCDACMHAESLARGGCAEGRRLYRLWHGMPLEVQAA